MSYKLVRDRNQELFQGKISGRWRASPDPVSALVRKLGEEYGEFCEQRDPAELWDILDVIRELITILDPLHAYREDHYRKREMLGMFSSHLEWNPLPEGDTWKDGFMNEEEERQVRQEAAPPG